MDSKERTKFANGRSGDNIFVNAKPLAISSYRSPRAIDWQVLFVHTRRVSFAALGFLCVSSFVFLSTQSPSTKTTAQDTQSLQYSAAENPLSLTTADSATTTVSLIGPITRLKEAEDKAESDKVGIASVILAQVSSKGNFEDTYASAEKKYGVSRYLLKAVHYVETRQKGDTDIESYAGAQGPMQFMPETFAAYAQDGDDDGRRQITDVHDAIFTAAKHLAIHAKTNGGIKAALYNYNHSNAYVEQVLSVARGFGYTQ